MIRFFATNNDEMQEVSNYLEQLFNARQAVKDSSKFSNGYYLIIIDDIDLSRKVSIINKILKEKQNVGFSLLILEEISKVPSEVTNFLVIGEKTSIIWDMANNSQRKFIEETSENYDMNACVKILANLPLYM